MQPSQTLSLFHHLLLLPGPVCPLPPAPIPVAAPSGVAANHADATSLSSRQKAEKEAHIRTTRSNFFRPANGAAYDGGAGRKVTRRRRLPSFLPPPPSTDNSSNSNCCSEELFRLREMRGETHTQEEVAWEEEKKEEEKTLLSSREGSNRLSSLLPSLLSV